MAKYIVKEQRPATQYWVYEIEAPSEEEALRMAQDGEVDATNYYVESNDSFEIDSEWDVELHFLQS